MTARYPSADARARIRQTVRRVEAMPRSTRGERRHFPQPWPGDLSKIFRIVGHTEIETGSARYEYNMAEAILERRGRYKLVPGGLVTVGYNRRESNNDGVDLEDSGIDVSELPPYMQQRPLGIGSHVRAGPEINCDGVAEWIIEVAIIPGGSCP